MHDPFYDLFPAPQEPPWEADQLVLVTIDMQYMDAHPDGWMGRVARSGGREDLLRRMENRCILRQWRFHRGIAHGKRLRWRGRVILP